MAALPEDKRDRLHDVPFDQFPKALQDLPSTEKNGRAQIFYDPRYKSCFLKATWLRNWMPFYGIIVIHGGQSTLETYNIKDLTKKVSDGFWVFITPGG